MKVLQIKGNTRASSLEQIILLAALNISNDYIDKNNVQNLYQVDITLRNPSNKSKIIPLEVIIPLGYP